MDRTVLKEKKKIFTIHNVVFTALFTALICVFTAYLPRIPTLNGYIHLGDSMIYLAASYLPLPLSLIAAAFGGGLADGLSGYMIYILPTMMIKTLNALCFSNKSGKILSKRNVIGVAISTVVTVVGYAVAEMILFGSVYGAIGTLLGNVIQGVGSGLLFIVISIPLDRMGVLKRLRIQN